MVIEIAVHAASDFRGLWTVSGTAALKKDYGYDSPEVRVGIRSEPTVTSAGLGAGAGLT